MPSSQCDFGLGPGISLSEYADDLFLESAINTNGSLEQLMLLGNTPSQSPSHPSTEDSFYPLDDTPFFSKEIWKKFDLPDAETSAQWSSCLDESSPSFDLNSLLLQGFNTESSALDAGGKGKVATTLKELRNHDCMWAGKCKNKEHVRNQSKTNGSGDHRVVAPGQTLLKNPVVSKDAASAVPSVMMAPSPMLTASPTVLRVPRNGVASSAGVVARSTHGKSVLVRTPYRTGGRPGEAISARVVTVRLPSEEKDPAKRPPSSASSSSARSFASSAASPRPETPVSLSEEEDEEGGTARCDVWGRGGSGARGPTPEDLEEAEAAAALAEAMALAAEEDEDCGGEAVSLSEVTGQVRMSGVSSASSSSSSITDKSNVCYLDHDYHMSNTSMKSVKTDHLGVQTPSDSEEEIDVVSLTGGEKAVPSVRSSPVPAANRNGKAAVGSSRQTSGRVNLPTNPSARDKHQLQLTVEAAIAKVSASVAANGFGDDFDEEYVDSDEEEEESEEEEEEEVEEEEEYEGYESSEGQRGQDLHYSIDRSHGGKSSNGGAKRHASDDLRGPSPKQSRVDRRHKRRRRQPRDEDPDYEDRVTSQASGWSNYSTSSAYHSSSSSGTASPPRRRGGHRKRPYRQSQEGGDSAPEDPLERRSMHNTMERQRRIDLRNAFENLRLLVPAVSEKERAAKVTILREAAGFCSHLTSVGVKHQDSLKALRAKQMALRAQVSSLRRSLAAAR